MCYKTKALFELGLYKESIAYAKQAQVIRINSDITDIINTCNKKIKNEYTLLGLNLDIYKEKVKKSIIKIHSSNQINIEILNKVQKTTFGNRNELNHSYVDLRKKNDLKSDKTNFKTNTEFEKSNKSFLIVLIFKLIFFEFTYLIKKHRFSILILILIWYYLMRSKFTFYYEYIRSFFR